jgi:hypothetical protein
MGCCRAEGGLLAGSIYFRLFDLPTDENYSFNSFFDNLTMVANRVSESVFRPAVYRRRKSSGKNGVTTQASLN